MSQNTNLEQNLDSIPKETENGDTLIDKEYRRLRISTNYSTSNSFLGKLDSLAVPIITNSIKYTTFNNFFYQINLIHGTKGVLYDELDTRFGYTKYINNLILSASYTHFFFNSNVERFNAIVNNDFNFYIAYDWYYLFTALSLDYTLGKKNFIEYSENTNLNKSSVFSSITTTKNIAAQSNDFNLTFINSRQFYIYEVLSKHDKFIISPEIDVIMGKPHDTYNESLTYDYYLKKKVNSKPIVQTGQKTYNLTQFFCSTIINLDLRYVYKNITFNLSPYYYIPYNIGIGVNERSSPYLVWYSSIFYTFKWEKTVKKLSNNPKIK